MIHQNSSIFNESKKEAMKTNDREAQTFAIEKEL